MEIRDFVGKTTASNSDLLLLQDGADNLFKHITKANLLAGLDIGVGSSAAWQIQSSNYTALVGDRVLVDLANTWILTLPSTPVTGNEIDIYIIAKSGSNKLNVNLQGLKFKSALPQALSCNALFAYTKLIYVNDIVGWTDLNNILLAVGTYAVEVLDSLPFVYLRLNDESGNKAFDSSINNRVCDFQGTVQYQQESSLVSDPSNKSIRFNGSNSRIFINPQIAAPSIYALECRFKTTAPNGQLFTFLLGGTVDRDLYLSNGSLILFNFQGAQISTPLTYNNDLWHIVTAVTCSRGCEIWVDGNLVVSSPISSTYPYNANWHIGWGNRGGYFNGLIDEASITHSELSAAKISARHQAAMA